MKRFLPWVIFAIFIIYTAATIVRPIPSPRGFNIAEFGRLPVMMSGRVLPIDTVARIALLQIRGTATVPIEETRTWQIWKATRRLDASEWLLEVFANPRDADGRRIFAIEDAGLVRTLHLRASASGYYAFTDLESKLDEIGKQATRIGKIDRSKRAAWEQNLLRLRNALLTYERLKNTLQPNSFVARQAAGKPVAYDFAARLAEYRMGLSAGVEAALAREHGKDQTLDKATEDAMRSFAQPFIGVSRVAMLAIIAPPDPSKARDHWENIGTVIVNSARTGQLPETVARFAGMASAFAQNRAEVFNREVWNHRQLLKAGGFEPEVSRARYEFFYNHVQPYVRAAAIYLVVLVLVSAYWYTRSAEWGRAAKALVALACVLHGTGLLFEMMIEGRPPTTNLFASIVLGGWVAVLIGGAIERSWRNGVGLTFGALAGAASLLTAHSLGVNGIVVVFGAIFDAPFLLALVALAAVVIFGRRIPNMRARTTIDADVVMSTDLTVPVA